MHPVAFTVRQPLWRNHTPHPPLCPAFLYGWLSAKNSLTARLRARCTRFGLQVLRQQRARPLADEAQALHIHLPRQLWLREVLLFADGEAVVFARSWLVSASERNRCPLFFNSGSQPLGERLFARADIRRGRLQYATLSAPDPRHCLAQRRTAQTLPPRLWMRRSCFNIGSSRLLVSEIFLPAIARLQP